MENWQSSTILEDFPRGVRNAREELPKTYWEDYKTIESNLHYQPHELDPGQIYLGEIDGQFIGTPPGEDRHALLCCGSRSGKGRSIIIPNLILGYKGSCLVIDPKGELAGITARRRSKEGRPPSGTDGGCKGLGQTIRILDPFNVTPPWVQQYKVSYNPLSILKPGSDTLVEDAQLIADALVVCGSSHEQHWDESAKNFLAGLILHVATHPKFEGCRTLLMMRSLLMMGTETTESAIVEETGETVTRTLRGMAALESEMRDSQAALGAVTWAASDLFDKPANERESVLSTARRHTKFLDGAHMREVLSANDFDLAELKTNPEGVTLYVCLPAGRMGTHKSWLRLFINLLLETMERVPGKPATGAPTLFLMDEFATLGHMQRLSDAAGQIAGFGVKLWPILQDLGQLQALYEKRWQTWIGNSGMSMFFGNSDTATLDYISHRLGKTTFERARTAALGAGALATGKPGIEFETRVENLLEPHEIAKLFSRVEYRALVMLADYAPMVLRRIEYDSHPFCRGKWDRLE